MKNGKLVTEYLDHCATKPNPIDDFEAWVIHGDINDDLWASLLNDGWAVAELDAMYDKRFGTDVSNWRRKLLVKEL